MRHSKLRIGLDGRVLSYPRSGLSAYLIALIEEFKKYPDIEIFLFNDREFSSEYNEILKGLNKIIFGFKYRKYWANYLLGSQLKKYQIDIYHANWDGGVPFFSPCPTIMTLHSINHLKRPPYVSKHMFRRKSKRIKAWFTFQIEKRIVKKIIVVSEYMKEYIHRYAHVPLNKMEVIYLGVDRNFRKIEDNKNLYAKLKDFSLDGKRYILTIPTRIMEERKNIPTLIKSFAYIFTHYNKKDLYLVVVGEFLGDEMKAKELLFSGIPLSIQNNVIFLGHIRREVLPYLLNGCELMVFPSLYEGFGLPLVEAFACGTAVVASNTSCIPEIAKDSAILVNPLDYKELGEAIVKVIENKELKEMLIKKGLERAKYFSWQENARKTYEIYKEIIEKFGRSRKI